MAQFSRKIPILLVSVSVVVGFLWYFHLRWVLQDPAKITLHPDTDGIISELLESSRTAEYEERQAICYKIRAMGRESLPVLVRALEDEDPGIRALAASLLRFSNNVHVISYLEAGLSDEEPAVIRTALFSLGQLGAVETVPTIIIVLSEGDKFTRCQAALVLGILKDENALVPLVARLENDPYPIARKVAADSLGEIGGEQAVPSLIDSLEDKNARVRLASLRALNRITKIGLGPEKGSWMNWFESEHRRSAAE